MELTLVGMVKFRLSLLRIRAEVRAATRRRELCTRAESARGVTERRLCKTGCRVTRDNVVLEFGGGFTGRMKWAVPGLVNKSQLK